MPPLAIGARSSYQARPRPGNRQDQTEEGSGLLQ